MVGNYQPLDGLLFILNIKIEIMKVAHIFLKQLYKIELTSDNYSEIQFTVKTDNTIVQNLISLKLIH